MNTCTHSIISSSQSRPCGRRTEFVVVTKSELPRCGDHLIAFLSIADVAVQVYRYEIFLRKFL